jgi:hypothetical protein
VQKALSDTLDEIQFVVEANGGEGSQLKEAVTGKINAMGFKTVPAPETPPAPGGPVLKIKCALTLERFDRSNPQWKFFLWKGTFEMSELAGGRVLASAAPSGTDGHIQEEAARTKARGTGEEALAQETQNQIGKYIFGE